MMARVATWMKDFCIAPFGKPMYEAEAARRESARSVHADPRMSGR